MHSGEEKRKEYTEKQPVEIMRRKKGENKEERKEGRKK